MAQSDDNSSASPTTLAGLWLKSKPKRPAPSPELPSAKPASSKSQMGLLFSSPVADPAHALFAPSPPTRSRRKVANTEAPTPSKRKRRSILGQPAAAPAATPDETRRIWTVRDLVTGIRQQVEQQYQDIWVEGEISNCRPAPSG